MYIQTDSLTTSSYVITSMGIDETPIFDSMVKWLWETLKSPVLISQRPYLEELRENVENVC